jgi:hypothetical protein
MRHARFPRKISYSEREDTHLGRTLRPPTIMKRPTKSPSRISETPLQRNSNQTELTKPTPPGRDALPSPEAEPKMRELYNIMTRQFEKQTCEFRLAIRELEIKRVTEITILNKKNNSTG